MAHGLNADFWERGLVCTVKTARHRSEYKSDKNEKIKSERTHKDNRDSLTKMKASATAALIKAKAEYAAHLVKASFMEQQYELEAKQRAVRRRLEELELETKIAEVTAKLAVLNASRKHKSSKSRSAQERPKPKPEISKTELSLSERSVPVFETGAGDMFDEVDWEGPEIFVPALPVCEDTGAGDELNEVDWEGLEIFVPVGVACDDAGAGDTAELQPDHRESPDEPLTVPVASEPQQEVQVPEEDLQDLTLKRINCENELHVRQPEVVAAGSPEDKEPEKTAVPVVGEGNCNELTVATFLPQVLGEPTLLDSCSMNSVKCTVAMSMMICCLFLLIGQVHKLFKLKRYKAFKRRKWKL